MSLAEAIAQAKVTAGERAQAGIDQAALEEAARAGLQLAVFETNEEDVPDILEEFYPNELNELEVGSGVMAISLQPLKESLAVKVNK